MKQGSVNILAVRSWREHKSFSSYLTFSKIRVSLRPLTRQGDYNVANRWEPKVWRVNTMTTDVRTIYTLCRGLYTLPTGYAPFSSKHPGKSSRWLQISSASLLHANLCEHISHLLKSGEDWDNAHLRRYRVLNWALAGVSMGHATMRAEKSFARKVLFSVNSFRPWLLLAMIRS